MASFEKLYANLICRLTNEDRVIFVSEQFSPRHEIEDMFSFLWSLEEAHQELTPSIIGPQKSEDKAEKLRSEGNMSYKKKLLDTALNLYNQSIMFARHPEVKIQKYQYENPETSCKAKQGPLESHSINGNSFSNENEDCYESLALAYANRSAVLFELAQYEKCICDIEYALLHGYPRILHNKLAERKAKCLIALGRLKEAKSLIETSIEASENLPLTKENKIKYKSSLQLLLQECQDLDKADVPSNLSEINSKNKYNLIFSFETPTPPQLAKHNPNIPSLSSSVDLGFSPDRGRYLFAKKDIKPGDMIAVEDPYCKVVHLDSSLHTHCTHCLARCLTPLPCPNCTQVIFCNTACRMQALASYHGPECGILSSLAALDIGKNSVLAYRILSKITFSRLRNLLPEYLAESVEKPSVSLGFDNNGKYTSSDYRTIFHLVGNKEFRSASDLFKRCSMAFVLLKLLEKSTKFFVDAYGVSFTPSVEDIVLTGSTLFRHMMNLPCNAHSISELKVDINNYQLSIAKDIGCGAFGVLSLTNHSCNPVVSRFSFGATIVVKAVKFISSGAEIRDCYGEHFCTSSLNDRTTSLLQQYYFKCYCEACQQQWPTYFDLPEEFKLKCAQCNHLFDYRGTRCLKCKLDYTKSSKNEILNVDIYKQFHCLEMDFTRAYNSVLAGENSPEIIKKICKFIEFIDKYVQQPCKVYCDAQETLKHCLDRQGSFFYGI